MSRSAGCRVFIRLRSGCADKPNRPIEPINVDRRGTKTVGYDKCLNVFKRELVVRIFVQWIMAEYWIKRQHEYLFQCRPSGD